MSNYRKRIPYGMMNFVDVRERNFRFVMKYFRLFLLTCLLNACSSPKENVKADSLETIHVEVENIREDMYLSEFSTAKIIPLSTTDEALIGGKFNRVKTSDKSICISDGEAIYRFSQTGEYLGKIAKKGQGPDQYLHINDFVLDGNENVWVASDHKKSLLLYSWDNRLIKEMKVNLTHIPCIHRLGDKLIIANKYYLPDNKHTLQVIDLNTGETINNFLPIDEFKAKYLIASTQITPGENDTVCYVNTTHNDTIYRVTPYACQPYRTFDWDGKNIALEYYHQDFRNLGEFYKSLPSRSIFGIHFQLHSDNYQWVGYMDKRIRAAIVPKGMGEHIVMDEIRIDELEGFPLGLWVNFSEENKFVTGRNEIIFMVQPMDILDYVEEHCPKAMDDIKKKIQYTSEDQNPILLVIKLK